MRYILYVTLNWQAQCRNDQLKALVTLEPSEEPHVLQLMFFIFGSKAQVNRVELGSSQAKESGIKYEKNGAMVKSIHSCSRKSVITLVLGSRLKQGLAKLWAKREAQD